ncbi:TPA: glycosyltransferase, partial [Vibrio cholerae]
IFIPHEGEPFLGWKFAFNKKQLNRCGAFLRFSKLYNKIPYYFSNETLLLSDIQRPLYPNANTINLLGIDSNVFKPESGIEKDVDIFFPSNISAPEKGFSRISHLLNDYMVIYPENTPNDQMPNLYCRAKIVVIPSVFETYGLVVLEALFCNSVVLVSSNVGVVHELLKVYSESKLESMGLFISDFISNDEIEMKVKCAMNFQKNNITMTRKLALDFGFTYKDSARKLIEYVRCKN